MPQETSASRMTECDNCGAQTPEDKLAKSLHEIDRLTTRLEVGSEVPAGECKCGCLAYLIPKSAVKKSTRRVLRRDS